MNRPVDTRPVEVIEAEARDFLQARPDTVSGNEDHRSRDAIAVTPHNRPYRILDSVWGWDLSTEEVMAQARRPTRTERANRKATLSCLRALDVAGLIRWRDHVVSITEAGRGELSGVQATMRRAA